MDSGSEYLWTIALSENWQWDALNHWGSGEEFNPEIDPVIFNLSAGDHILKIKQREDGTKLDQLLITNNMSYVPGNIEDTTPPAGISNLQSTTGTTWINWTWSNPEDDDFSHTMVYLNGIWKTNTSDAYYNATDLAPDTTHEIGTRTVDTNGNLNTTWVNQTATTLAVPNGAVSGIITSTADGTSISGVTVNLTLNSTGTVVASTTTDSNGDYLMTDQAPGEYTLTVSKIRFWSDSMSVTVNPGASTTINCALWLKGDLNNNGISVDAGDRAMMKDASVGKIELL